MDIDQMQQDGAQESDPVAAPLVDIIEQAIFETGTGLEAALLADERVAEQGYVLVNAEAEAAQSADGLLAALLAHVPTVWTDNGGHYEQIRCKCGLRDTMAGWWAHLRVEVIEPALDPEE